MNVFVLHIFTSLQLYNILITVLSSDNDSPQYGRTYYIPATLYLQYFIFVYILCKITRL
jgi:hypothetical protein